MKGKGLSDKEAALIAAARRESGLQPLAAGVAAPRVVNRGSTAQSVAKASPQASAGPTPATLKIKPQATAAAPAKPDIATRMALLMETERAALQERKSRIKRNYMIGISAVLVPAFLYVFVNLFRLLVH
jgi:hypothetical protein